MTNIQFDEEQQYQPAQRAEQKSFLVRFILSTGIVSTEKQSEYVLLGIVIVIILATISIIMTGGVSRYAMPTQGLPSAYGP